MSIEFHWDNDDKTVIRFVMAGDWNWNEFHKNLRRSTFWFDSAPPGVETIMDFRGSHRLPAGAMGHIRSLGKRIHPHGQDRVIIIGLDAAVAAPLGGANRTYSDGQRLIRFVDSDEEAQAVLAEWQQA